MSHLDELIRYTRKQLKRLDSNLRRSVATGDVEAIHDLRVASRRLDEPLNLMAGLTKDKSGRELQRSVQRLRQAFRTVRDLDVLLLGLAHAPAENILQGGHLARLEGTLSAQRESAFSKALKKHRRLKADKLPSQIDRFGKRLAKRKTGADLDSQLASMLVQRRSELLEYDPHTAVDSDLHKARIRLKRFRYAIELACYIKRSKEDDLIQSLMKMQERLGKWNDNLVAVSTISSIASDAQTLPFQTKWSAHVLRYAASRAEKAEEFRVQILENWSSFLAAIQSSANSGADHASIEEDAHATANQE